MRCDFVDFLKLSLAVVFCTEVGSLFHSRASLYLKLDFPSEVLNLGIWSDAWLDLVPVLWLWLIVVKWFDKYAEECTVYNVVNLLHLHLCYSFGNSYPPLKVSSLKLRLYLLDDMVNYDKMQLELRRTVIFPPRGFRYQTAISKEDQDFWHR